MSEPNEAFSDPEYEFLRHVRFGELPPRIRPEDRIEVSETEPRRDRPDPALGRYEEDLRSGG